MTHRDAKPDNCPIAAYTRLLADVTTVRRGMDLLRHVVADPEARANLTTAVAELDRAAARFEAARLHLLASEAGGVGSRNAGPSGVVGGE